MFKLFLYGFLVYFLYKVIFQVVIPVSKGVKKVRQNMEQMQRQQADAFKQAQNRGPSSTQNPEQHTSGGPKKEVPTNAEYIDFEEVKK
jgi:hypothetical protein